MKDTEKAHIMIANLVFTGLSIDRMDKIPKWLLQNIEKNIPSFMDNLLETQALAIEGMKDETKDPCSTVYNMSDWGKKCANEALQQAVDHLRAQKTNTPTGGKN